MPRPPKERIHERSRTTLAHLRTCLGITQARLADSAGITQSVISDYEHGLDMSLDHAYALLQALKVLVPKDLLGSAPVRVLICLNPSDLPRSWEHVQGELETRTTCDNNYHTHDGVVA